MDNVSLSGKFYSIAVLSQFYKQDILFSQCDAAEWVQYNYRTESMSGDIE